MTASPDAAIVRYNGDGTRDTDFGIDGLVNLHHTNGQLKDMAILSDDKIVLGGSSDGSLRIYRFNPEKYNP